MIEPHPPGSPESPVTAEVIVAAARARGPRMAEHVEETWAAYPSVIAEFFRVTGEEGTRALAQTLMDAAGNEKE